MEKQTNSFRQGSNKTAHFTRQADYARRQLSDLEVRIIFLEKQVEGVARTNPAAKPTFDLIDDLKRRAKEFRTTVSRSLFNAGRV